MPRRTPTVAPPKFRSATASLHLAEVVTTDARRTWRGGIADRAARRIYEGVVVTRAALRWLIQRQRSAVERALDAHRAVGHEADVGNDLGHVEVDRRRDGL